MQKPSIPDLTDLVFAVDSVPAIFAITQDPFIVYTSNIFAVLGLRSLYFALSALMHRFVYLMNALALVLIFIGCKIFYHGMVGMVPALLSLGSHSGCCWVGWWFRWSRREGEGGCRGSVSRTTCKFQLYNRPERGRPADAGLTPLLELK